MNPNEIQITNVFVRPIGQLAPDDTLPWAGGGGCQIVVQWTAGAAENAKAVVDIDITAAIWDYFLGAPACAPIAIGPVGPAGASENGTYESTAPLPAFPPAPPSPRALEVFVWLARPNAGITTTTSFYRGPLFVVY